ncbi:MAG: DUF1330 domain-containing protein [Thermomicrobiales bacterium]
MPAYVIVGDRVTDPDMLAAYARGVGETLRPFGGRLTVGGGAVEVLEGAWLPERLIILTFPDAAQARAWYASPAYQAIVAQRVDATETHFFVIADGVVEP